MAHEKRTMQIRGELSLDKIKAAQVLGGDQVKFELRAMKPVKAGQIPAVSCIVCFVCFVCVVCLVARAEENGIRLWKELPAELR